MSTTMVETSAVAAKPAVVSAPPTFSEPAPALQLVKPTSVVSVPEEITFLDDHPLVPVVVIGAIAMIMAIVAVGSIVFWLAIRYSGVLAP